VLSNLKWGPPRGPLACSLDPVKNSDFFVLPIHKFHYSLKTIKSGISYRVSSETFCVFYKIMKEWQQHIHKYKIAIIVTFNGMLVSNNYGKTIQVLKWILSTNFDVQIKILLMFFKCWGEYGLIFIHLLNFGTIICKRQRNSDFFS